MAAIDSADNILLFGGANDTITFNDFWKVNVNSFTHSQSTHSESTHSESTHSESTHSKSTHSKSTHSIEISILYIIFAIFFAILK
jgi:hypothetical protein